MTRPFDPPRSPGTAADPAPGTTTAGATPGAGPAPTSAPGQGSEPPPGTTTTGATPGSGPAPRSTPVAPPDGRGNGGGGPAVPDTGQPAQAGGGPPGPDGADDHLEVSGTQVAASVLASVSAAVVASFFGVAGTVVGAAVVSVVATVGSAAYGVGIRRTRARLRNVQVRQAASLRHSRPSPAVPVAGHGHDRPEGDGDVPSAAGGQAGGRAPRWWPGALARRRWSLAGGLAVVLAGSLGIVTVAEVVNDGPLAGGSHGGRTSIGSLISDDGGDPAPTSTTVDRSPTTTAPTAEPDRQDAPDGGDEPDGSSPTTSEPTSTTEPSGTTTGPDATTTTTPAPTTSLPAGDGTAPTVRSGSATP